MWLISNLPAAGMVASGQLLYLVPDPGLPGY